MNQLATILREAKIESDRLDVKVCGGAKRSVVKRSRRQNDAEDKAIRVELYTEQWACFDRKDDDSDSPDEGGEIVYEVDEMRLYDKQMRFCQRMIECGILIEEDFEQNTYE
jgi:hypothetical protein